MHARSTEDARHLIGPAITDVAGEPAGQTQVDRLVARYHWVASHASGRTVLEVACGTGQGLGLLSERANKVIGCDLSAENLARARATYTTGIPLVRADAQKLPFADASVDVVVLLETLYFLPSADDFVREAGRVLRPGGKLLISAINKDCPDFNPNHPLYFAHYGAVELASIMRKFGFAPECFGIVPMDAPSVRSRVFSPLKKLAVRLNLIPDSMQARLFLKRVVFGRLLTMPADIRGLAAPAVPPTKVRADVSDLVHQVILCEGTRG